MFWKRKDKLSVTPLGGADGYVGHNCFLYESGKFAVVVDCGIKPQTYEERKRMREAGLVPNPNWVDSPPGLNFLDDALRKGRDVVCVKTHAHLDHIGAVRELSRRRIPVHISQPSKLFMERYAENLKIPVGAEFRIFNQNTILKHGDIEISFVPLQHSIPGNYGVLMRAGGKSVLHLGDFKFNGLKESIDETRRIFQEIHRKVGRINCLVMDILNAEIEGFTPPEQLVLDSIDKIVSEARGRVMITFFSSNLQRMEGILKIAKSQRKRVAVFGWGMSDSYLRLTGREPSQYGDIILVSGSQGEEDSGLVKMAKGEHKFLRLLRRDTVVNSSRCIPGNEEAVSETTENLHKYGVTIFLHQGETKKLGLSFEPEEELLHVSGHEQRGGLLEVRDILDPDVIVPFHAP